MTIKTTRSDPMFRDLAAGEQFRFGKSLFRKVDDVTAECLEAGNSYHKPGARYRFCPADHIGQV